MLRGLETRINVGDHPQPVPYLLYGWRILVEPLDKSVGDAMTNNNNNEASLDEPRPDEGGQSA